MANTHRAFSSDANLAWSCICPHAGAGSDKLALLEAEATGTDWRSLGLPEAPHYLEKDGSVQVPHRWQYIVGQEEQRLQQASGSPQQAT